MAVNSVTWVAHRVRDRESIDEARRLAGVLDLGVLADDGDKLMLRTVRGDVLEYCAPTAAVPDHLFRDQDVVVGYLVDDLPTTVAALRANGFEPVTEVVDAGPVLYQHVIDVDGQVFGVLQNTV